MIEQQPAMFIWAGSVGLAIAAGAWTATNRRATRPTLPPEHVAAAAIIGVFGWEIFVHLPGNVMGFWTMTAGLGDVRGVEGYQVYLAAQVAYIVATAVAVVGILRRRVWGAVLGIGLAFVRVVWSGAILFQTIFTFGDVVGNDLYLEFVISSIGLQAVPALVAIALLAWPLVRRTTPSAQASDAEWPAGTAPLEHAD